MCIWPAGHPPDLRCVFSCFEEGTYIQHRGQGGWELKLDVATVVKSVKPEDEIHMRFCLKCYAWPIRGPCYADLDNDDYEGFCQSCFKKLDEEERAHLLERAQYSLSLCEPANVGPQLLTEGLVSTTNAEGLVVDEDSYDKQDRDICFPLEIMEKAYNKDTQIEITKAQASVQDDFKRIINSIKSASGNARHTRARPFTRKLQRGHKPDFASDTLIAIAGEPGTAQHVCQGCTVAGSRQGR